MAVVKILCCLILALSGGYMRFENLTDSFSKAESMVVTVENIETRFNKGDQKYQEILEALEFITKDAHEMPAFGVSLDEHTREHMKTGTWLELNFSSTCTHDCYDFDALLIYIHKGDHGFNLVRKVGGKYEGRCFYLSLETSNNKLCEVIEGLAVNKDK